MTKTDKHLQLYLQKLFPRFSSPLSSRFSGLFYEISKTNLTQPENLTKIGSKNEKESQNFEKYRIYPEKILNGIETRTSIIIKDIPGAFGAMNFYNLLTIFSNQINCFYIPGFAIEKWEYIYAFVTIDNIKGVLDIYEGLTLLKNKFKTFKGYDFSKIEVYYCRSQSKTSFMKKCLNKSDSKSIFISK